MADDKEGLIYQPVIPQTDRRQQEPQDISDRHGPGYDNDHKNDWVRGGGKGQATGKPSFDSTADRLSGGKHRNTP